MEVLPRGQTTAGVVIDGCEMKGFELACEVTEKEKLNFGIVDAHSLICRM